MGSIMLIGHFSFSNEGFRWEGGFDDNRRARLKSGGTARTLQKQQGHGYLVLEGFECAQRKFKQIMKARADGPGSLCGLRSH
jgi:hypothetical protein